MDPILQLNDLDLVFLDQSSPCHIAHHLDASSRQSAEVPAIKSVPLRVTTIKTQSQYVPFHSLSLISSVLQDGLFYGILLILS